MKRGQCVAFGADGLEEVLFDDVAMGGECCLKVGQSDLAELGTVRWLSRLASDLNDACAVVSSQGVTKWTNSIQVVKAWRCRGLNQFEGG